jgi:mono/diheme cytochrome c family protein
MIQVNAACRKCALSEGGVKEGSSMRRIPGLPPFLAPVLAPVLAMTAIVCLTITPRPAQADPTPEAVAAGQKLAQKYCADCHVIESTPKPAWNDPPPFQTTANRSDVTAASLVAHIRKPHANLATNARPPAEAEALAAYILSLRKH